MAIFTPEAFQGNLKGNRYFEGWYLKQVAANRVAVYSFIPGISLAGKASHAFIQVINGLSGQTQYLTYPLSSFSARRDCFDVTIGNNHFGRKGLSLDIDQDGTKISGELSFVDSISYPASPFAPGIMGWYSYVPFMECFHGVVSITHRVMGSLMMNNVPVNFSDGNGYIEKDWGRSFPDGWIWFQCNSFNTPGSSIMMSVARIPWMGHWFLGFLGFIYHEGILRPFATWNGSKIQCVERHADGVSLVVTRNNLTLQVTAQSITDGMLKAPTSGIMDRRIKESLDASLSVKLTDNDGALLADLTGTHAGLEVVDPVFTYLREAGIPCISS
jgi:tocopherol cyclase